MNERRFTLSVITLIHELWWGIYFKLLLHLVDQPGILEGTRANICHPEDVQRVIITLPSRHHIIWLKKIVARKMTWELFIFPGGYSQIEGLSLLKEKTLGNQNDDFRMEPQRKVKYQMFCKNCRRVLQDFEKKVVLQSWSGRYKSHWSLLYDLNSDLSCWWLSWSSSEERSHMNYLFTSPKWIDFHFSLGPQKMIKI